jgi:hypothetical protein
MGKIPRGLKMSLQESHNSSIIGTVKIVMRIFGEEKKLEKIISFMNLLHRIISVRSVEA